MSVWIDPAAIARAMGDGTAGHAANDNRRPHPDSFDALPARDKMIAGVKVSAAALAMLGLFALFVAAVMS